MNRDIKFRAWVKSAKEMVTQEEPSDFVMVSNGDGFGIVDGRDDSEYSNGSWIDEKDFELMQFTGLTDKNGKEIYEGDIVKVFIDDIDQTIHQVKYFGDDYYPAFDLSPNLDIEANGLAWACCANDYEIEVIGNIYENKELLNAEQ